MTHGENKRVHLTSTLFKEKLYHTVANGLKRTDCTAATEPFTETKCKVEWK